MKPVQQTVFGEGRGNCLAACVASVLELPIESVPNFALHEDVDEMFHQFREFVQSKGYSVLDMDIRNAALDSIYFDSWPGHVIVSGKSLNTPGCYHAVVGKLNGWRVQIVHDPHPKNLGVELPPTSLRFLLPLREGVPT